MQSCVKQKMDVMARLHDVLQGTVKPSAFSPLPLLLSVRVLTKPSPPTLSAVITQCCIQALYDAGEDAKEAVEAAKGFERRKCNHFKARKQDECMLAMAGTLLSSALIVRLQMKREELQLTAPPCPGRPHSAGEQNKNRYVFATQSLPLRESLRAVPGSPILYIARSVMLLEAPSNQTLAKKRRVSHLSLTTARIGPAEPHRSLRGGAETQFD